MIMAGVVGFVTRRERQVSAPHPERSEGPSMRMSGTPEQDPSLRSG
jgi:hypothetical protein